jgi:hypothetical protein
VTRLVDLDDLAGLQAAWVELERVRAIRAVDPELRATILRRLDHIDPADAEPIRAALDELHPEVVLAVHFKTITASLRRKAPAGGEAVGRQQPPLPRSPSNPVVYTKVLRDMVEVGWPEEVAAKAVANMATRDGLDADVVVELVTEVLYQKKGS